MKKIAALFLTLGFVVLFVPSVSAGIRYTGQNPVWKCLNIPKDKAGNALSCGNKAAGCSGQGVTGHRVKLTMSGLYPAKDVFLVGCISTEIGNGLCTTGDQTADDTIYGDWKNGKLVKPSTNLADLKNTYKYEFQGLYKKDGVTRVVPSSPVKAEPSGELTPANAWYEWQDFTPVSRRRKWVVLQYADPKKAPEGKAGGNQQGILDFETSISNCASISWDPYGALFDAKTLEPIEGATITLQVLKDNVFRTMTVDDMLGGDIYNPQTTYAEGKFEYVVPDGDYKLLTDPIFLTDLKLIDPNYTKAYSEIYTGEVIQQRGEIQHRDIAIPTRNTNNPPSIINFFYQASPYGTVTFDGDVSHPLTKLHIKTAKVSASDPSVKTPYRTLGTYQANKVGAFRFEMDQNMFEITPEYTEVIAGLELEKVDLRSSDSAGIKTVTKLEPIPQYLEGYAYDKAGKPLVNANVAIMVPHSQAPYYETVTDEKGFYKVTSDHLSGSNFDIKYTMADNTEVTVSPSLFLAQNQEYLAKQAISPWVGRDSNGTTSPTGLRAQELAKAKSANQGEKSSLGGLSEQEKNNASSKAMAAAQNNKAMTQMLILVAIIILLVVGAGGVVLYLKTKQSTPPQVM